MARICIYAFVILLSILLSIIRCIIRCLRVGEKQQHLAYLSHLFYNLVLFFRFLVTVPGVGYGSVESGSGVIGFPIAWSGNEILLSC